MDITAQQWQSYLRWLVDLLAGSLISHGLLAVSSRGSFDDLLMPIVTAAAGAIMAGATLLWKRWSHKPSTIIATANALQDAGKVQP